MAAEGPVLTPLWVAASDQPSQQYLPQTAGSDDARYAAKVDLANVMRDRAMSSASSMGRLDQEWRANQLASRIQLEELASDPDVPRRERGRRSTQAPLTVSYHLESRISVRRSTASNPAINAPATR